MNISQYNYLRSGDWKKKALEGDERIRKVPTMLNNYELKLLSILANEIYTGEGEIVELGAFLGGSTSYLAHGLDQNKNANGHKIKSYDLFEATTHQRQNVFPRFGVHTKEDDLLPLVKSHLGDYTKYVDFNKGNLLEAKITNDLVEILFVDIMKSGEICDFVLKNFFTKLITKKSVVLLQDYYFKKTGIWHQILFYRLKEKLVYLTDTDVCTAAFLCVDNITREDIEKTLWANTKANNKLKVNATFHALKYATSEKQTMALRSILLQGIDKKIQRKGQNWNPNANANAK